MPCLCDAGQRVRKTLLAGTIGHPVRSTSRKVRVRVHASRAVPAGVGSKASRNVADAMGVAVAVNGCVAVADGAEVHPLTGVNICRHSQQRQDSRRYFAAAESAADCTDRLSWVVGSTVLCSCCTGVWVTLRPRSD